MRDFIGRRKTDRIGAVVFGADAYVVSPPTLDYHLLDELVKRMDTDLIDSNGTAIGDALGVAIARLRRSTAKSKAIILVTDGANQGGPARPEYTPKLATSSARTSTRFRSAKVKKPSSSRASTCSASRATCACLSPSIRGS